MANQSGKGNVDNSQMNTNQNGNKDRVDHGHSCIGCMACVNTPVLRRR